LLGAMTASLSGNNDLPNLQSIGIQLQGDGTLSVASSSSADSMDLNDALTNDYSAVQNLFQSTSGPGQTLQNTLTALTDSVSGPLNVDMNGISSVVSDLNSQISDFQSNLQNTQTQLMTEYSDINTTLEELPETISSINSQIQALNPQTTQS
jgi:flagellar hook-associated protein 2